MNENDDREHEELEEALRGLRAPTGFTDEVMARVRTAKPESAGGGSGRLLSFPQRFAAAAAAILLVVLPLAFLGRDETSAPDPAPIPTATSLDLVRRARLFVAQIGQVPDDALILDLTVSGLERTTEDDLASLPLSDRALLRRVSLAARAANNGAPLASAELVCLRGDL